MKEIIMRRLNCSEKRAALIEGDLLRLSPPLVPALNAWLEKEDYTDDTRYHGYSIHSLMQDMDMRFTGAILTIDWIIREPEKALAALAEPIR